MRRAHTMHLYALGAVLAALTACAAKAPIQPAAPPSRAEAVPKPPVAKVEPHRFEELGHVRIDDYYWLKERSNPDVAAHLKAENDYLSAVMKHTKALQEKLFNEITGRLKQDDSSVPYKLDDYWYYTRFVEGGDYEYMLSYSPYDNLERKAYPNLLVTTGLHDSQVQYWEPAKWVARLRALKTDSHILLLRTNMEAGHGGASGRFRRLEETAFQFAFMLKLAGIDR